MATRTVRGVLAAVLVAAAMLLLLDVRGSGPGAALRGLAGAVSAPPAEALSWVRTEAGARFGGAADEQARIAQLEQELMQARTALGERVAGQADDAAARALRAALPLAGYTPVSARVVARAAPQDLTAAVAVSTGSDAGVAAGMLVLDSSGVVGVVASVAPRMSTVRLVSDRSSRLAVRVQSSAEAGVLEGSGERIGTMTLLDPLGTMAAGDRIVTIATTDGTVPADLPLGVITKVFGSAADLTRAAHVQLHVDASTLDRVAVLVPQARP